MPVLELRLGDVVKLRKVHPCGGYDWEIVRLGADIGLRCLKCQHRVMIERPTVEKRIKQFISRGPLVLSNVEGDIGLGAI